MKLEKGRNIEVMTKVNGRLTILFFIFLLAMGTLVFRLGWQQIVRGEEYEKKALENHLISTSVEARRGEIFDSNGNALTQSGIGYDVTIQYKDIAGSDELYNENTYEENIEEISALVGEEYSIIKKKIESPLEELEEAKKSGFFSENEINDSSGGEKEEGESDGNFIGINEVISFNFDPYTNPVVIKEKISQDLADKIISAEIPGVEVREKFERYYPNDAFASHVIGFVNGGEGFTGIEAYYNEELSGEDGRWIISEDAAGNELAGKEQEYYPAVPGSDVVLTIDQAIQFYAEDAVHKAYEENGSERVSAIVMEVETGAILASATAPSYDLNNPKTPVDEKEKELFNALTDKEQNEYLDQLWRNPIINDVYEPGSTMKLLTTAMSLEEGQTSLEDTFFCSGTVTVADRKINCWVHPGSHGTQTLAEAVSNSCNPPQVELATNLGIEKFYDYLDLFGMTEISGVDYSSEAGPILQSESEAGPVGIATIGFGQGIAVTPLHMITAISSLGNEGKLMEPHLVEKIISPDGEEEIIEPNVVRSTVSAETAEQVKSIMTTVVQDGTATGAKIAGYTVGGKTGTSEVVGGTGYTSEYDLSFVGMAPMEDPKIAVLIVNEKPRASDAYSSIASIPWVKEIMENTLNYLKIPSSGNLVASESEKKEEKTVPNVVGMNEKEAKETLSNAGFISNISPKSIEGTDFEVKAQFPVGNEKAPKGSVVYIYKE